MSIDIFFVVCLKLCIFCCMLQAAYSLLRASNRVSSVAFFKPHILCCMLQVEYPLLHTSSCIFFVICFKWYTFVIRFKRRILCHAHVVYASHMSMLYILLHMTVMYTLSHMLLVLPYPIIITFLLTLCRAQSHTSHARIVFSPLQTFFQNSLVSKIGRRG